MARLEEQWKKEEEEEQRQAEERKKERIMSNAKDKNHIPRCPTCGSQDLNRLSPANINGAFTLEAQLLAHIAMQLQKTFECNNCGYRW